jgi:hypothetical protein
MPLKELRGDGTASARKVINITPYKEVDKLLFDFAQGVDRILERNLIGMYLSGSLSYEGFNPMRSDIDLVTISKHPSSSKEIELIKGLHKEIESNHQVWAERLECSYLPIDMLENIYPPKAPRPYYNNKTFYEEASYGNEWIINNYLLYEHAVPLIGPPFKELTEETYLKNGFLK